MNNAQDKSFLDEMQQMDPAYKLGREYLAEMGIDIATMQPMPARPMNIDPAVAKQLGFGITPPEGLQQYDEPAGPPSPFNEYGQPVGRGGLYRRAANTIARGAGHVAARLTRGIGGEAGRQGAYDVAEGATRTVLTQTIPGLLELPQKLLAFREDSTQKMNADLAVVVRELGQNAAKAGNMEQAAGLEASAQELEATIGDHGASEAAERIVNSIVNEPATPGERTGRDAISIIAGFLATRKILPAAASGRVAQYAQTSGAGYLADKVFTDPRRDSAVEGLLEMISPAAADGIRNYISTGDTKELQELNKRLGRRELEGGFGLVVGGAFDLILGAAKHLRLARVADDWTQTKAKVEAAEQAAPGSALDPELEAEVTKILDDLQSLMDPENAARVNEGAAAEAQAAGLPPVGAPDAGLKIEGADAGPLPDAALGRLQQLPGVHQYMGRMEGQVLRQTIETLDNALGEVNDLSAVGTRAQRVEARAGAQEAGRKFKAGVNEEAQANMAGAMAEAPIEQADEGMGQIADLQDELQPGQGAAGYAQSPNQTADELFDIIDGTLGRNQEAGEMFGTVGGEGERLVDAQGRQAANTAAKSMFDNISGTTTVSEIADKLFADLDYGKLDTDTSDFDVLLDNVDETVDARPITKGAANDMMLEKGSTPEATALRYVVGSGANVDVERGAAAIAEAHGVDPKEARQLIDMARYAVSDPTTETWAKVASATNQPAEQSAVEVALAMNPFPSTKVADEAGMPKPVFHGTTSVYDKAADKFMGSGAGGDLYGAGHYFTEDPEVASEYAGTNINANVRKVYLNVQDPFDMDKVLDEEAAARLSQTEYGFLMDEGMTGDRYFNELADSIGGPEEARKVLESVGYDGITHTGGHIVGDKPHRVWIAFHANQIKNAFGGLDGAVEQLVKATSAPEKAAAKQGARKPRGQGAGMKQATIVAGRLEKGESSPASAVKAIGRAGKLNDKKAAEMLMRVLEMRNSPIIQSIANHPDIQKALGGAALAVVLTWALGNPALMKAIQADNQKDAA